MLYLAQSWQLDPLLDAAQHHVASRMLGPGNAVEWLVCAHLRHYSVLYRAALRAVVERWAEVTADPAQAALLEAHPQLREEALEHVAVPN